MNCSLRSFIAGFSALLLLSSCASISVDKTTEHNTTSKPKKIYVATFNTTHGEFNVDRTGKELDDFKRDLRNLMQTSMVNDLSTRLIPAVPAKKGHEFDPEDGWLIRGEFTKVNQGSRFLRSSIGLGAGGTKMETKIYVYDLTQNSGRPIMTFCTTGGSNAEPGAITSIAPNAWIFLLGASVGGVGGAARGVTDDTTRTSREVTAQISDYLHQRGWIPDSQWLKPKTLTSDIPASKTPKSSSSTTPVGQGGNSIKTAVEPQ